jgi:hypothetical protein
MDLLSSSAELGDAPGGGAKRRPWRPSSGACGCAWEREPERGGGENGEPRVPYGGEGLLIGDEWRR